MRKTDDSFLAVMKTLNDRAPELRRRGRVLFARQPDGKLKIAPANVHSLNAVVTDVVSRTEPGEPEFAGLVRHMALQAALDDPHQREELRTEVLSILTMRNWTE